MRRKKLKWKNWFEPHILERGYDYYCDDRVEVLKVTDDCIEARVNGTEDYRVEISLSFGEIEDMYCSCPYAEDDRNCKHMAAVLYQWTEGSDDFDDFDGTPERGSSLGRFQIHEEYDKKKEAVKALIKDADKETLSDFMTEVLMADEKLLVRFRNIVHGKENADDAKHYKKMISAIAKRYLGRDNFISYDQSYDFAAELTEIIEEDVHRMIGYGDFDCAFEIVNHIFLTLDNVDMDDSGGEISMIAQNVYAVWLELLSKEDSRGKRKMFEWFLAHLDGSVVDYLEEYIEEIIFEGFTEEEFKQDKLAFAEEMISKSEKVTYDWSRNYLMGKWALEYLEMLGKEAETEQVRKDFCKKYWKPSDVRRYYIKLCLEKEEYEEAINVLDESILLDKGYWGLISEYSEMKKDIFLLKGDMEAYKNQLWELVLEHKKGDVKCFRELKKLYTPEEWLFEREEIFAKLRNEQNVDKLYKEEKLYDRLLDYVLRRPGLYALQEYENILMKKYPKELIEKYTDVLDEMALRPNGRSAYRQLVYFLRRMQKLDGGVERAQEIANEWKTKYRNRPAMMEELGKL